MYIIIYIYIVTRTYVCMYICSMYMHMYTYSHIDKSAQHACLRSSCNKEQHFPNVQNEKSHSLVDTHTYKGAGRCFSMTFTTAKSNSDLRWPRNWPDDDIRLYAWTIISTTLSIFTAVLSFSGVRVSWQKVYGC